MVTKKEPMIESDQMSKKNEEENTNKSKTTCFYIYSLNLYEYFRY